MSSKFDELRKKAERTILNYNQDISNLSVEEIKKLAYELQVYKAELEIQNEELRRTQLELQRTSDLFFNLFNSAPVGYLILDDKINIIKTNYTFLAMTGYPASEVNSSNFLKFIDESSKNNFLSRYKAFYNNPIGKTLEIKIRSKNDEIIDIRIEGIKILSFDDENQNANLFTAIIDISEKVKKEEELINYKLNLEKIIQERTSQLNQLNLELSKEIEKRKEYESNLQNLLNKEIEINQIKSKFISITSHEFRTPLASIQSSFEILEKYDSKLSPERKKEHFNKIKLAINTITDLLNDLLRIDKESPEKLNFRPEKINLRLLIYDCIEKIKFSCDKKYSFEFNYNSNSEEYILDYRMMTYIINNLLSNAVKFSPNGGKIITEVNQINSEIFISIKDQGIGIPEDEIEKIFDPFYRANNAETIKGTGLGLSIVKSSVDLHNGRIIVKSQLTKGTEFQIFLPIR
ncbi:MAG: PAS domain-containing sensor histidine kinase [Ignavibacterium sp.]|nr:PAS domain-containing sensor histidine kinase [Ignavibacterium sp.]